jgi:hypothetical protein
MRHWWNKDAMCTAAPASSNTGASTDFLLHEYDAIETDTQRLRQEGATRLNILVALIAASLAASATALTSDRLSFSSKLTLGCGVLFSVGVYTLLCYKYFIDREITTDANFRALGRIRRYFVYADSRIVPHVSWQTSDGPTHTLKTNKSFVLLSVRHLAAVQASIFTFAWVRHYLELDQAWVWLTVCVTYAAIFAALWIWSEVRFRSAIKRAEKHMRFPQ